LKKFWLFDWYGHQILVWPIAALRNELSANKKGDFSVRSHAETGFKGLRVWECRVRGVEIGDYD